MESCWVSHIVQTDNPKNKGNKNISWYLLFLCIETKEILRQAIPSNFCWLRFSYAKILANFDRVTNSYSISCNKIKTMPLPFFWGIRTCNMEGGQNLEKQGNQYRKVCSLEHMFTAGSQEWQIWFKGHAVKKPRLWMKSVKTETDSGLLKSLGYNVALGKLFSCC